jgi:beta-N-acetylhexosaminidase
MRIKKVILVFSAAALVVITGLAVYFFTLKQQVQIVPSPALGQENKMLSDLVVLKVAAMPLDQKIGQLLIVGFESKYLDDNVQKMIKEYHIGGINLLKRNVQDRNQIRQLTTDLQKISAIPLFIAADQEGGKVVRFDFLNELTPQIKIKKIQEAEKIAFTRARELQEMGINMNFSPVLDYVSDNESYLYNRTFGTDRGSIGDLGSAMVKGYRAGGVISVAKHFPGYGNVFVDPHTHQATLTIDKEELESNLIPFQIVITNNPTVAIMTAHIAIPVIDAKPATISSQFLSEILRKKLGFNGVIITDDMEMVSAGDSIEQSSVEAIKAGADMIISTYTPEKQIKIFNRLKNAILNGEVTEERINQSVVRVLTLKSTLSKEQDSGFNVLKPRGNFKN